MKFIYYLLIVAGVAGALFWLSAPFRHKISDRFVARGKSYLSAVQYDKAFVEFSSAKKYSRSSSQIDHYLKLTSDTAKDITSGIDYFAKNNQELAEKIKSAGDGYPHAKAALESGISYLESGENQLALVAVQKAVKMDPAYPDAWRVLAKTYQTLAISCPKKAFPSCQKYFNSQAKSASTKLKELDPTSVNQ